MAPRKTTIQPVQPTTRAALYLRVSTDEQAKEGYGLDVQRQRCEAMALVKGWSVVRQYADEGISGTKDEKHRPALAELLADVEAGQIDAVIVLALDRLGRLTPIVLDLVDRLTRMGVEVVSCKESIDTTTAMGKFMITVFAGLAQLDRDNIVERTTAGRNARGAQDGEKGGQLPYGYARSEAGPVIDQAEAENVRYILRHRRSGKSYRAIAAELNAKGIPSARGGKWYATAIKLICENKAIYQGGQRKESAVSWPILA